MPVHLTRARYSSFCGARLYICGSLLVQRALPAFFPAAAPLARLKRSTFSTTISCRLACVLAVRCAPSPPRLPAAACRRHRRRSAHYRYAPYHHHYLPRLLPWFCSCRCRRARVFTTRCYMRMRGYGAAQSAGTGLRSARARAAHTFRPALCRVSPVLTYLYPAGCLPAAAAQRYLLCWFCCGAHAPPPAFWLVDSTYARGACFRFITPAALRSFAFIYFLLFYAFAILVLPRHYYAPLALVSFWFARAARVRRHPPWFLFFHHRFALPRAYHMDFCCFLPTSAYYLCVHCHRMPASFLWFADHWFCLLTRAYHLYGSCRFYRALRFSLPAATWLAGKPRRLPLPATPPPSPPMVRWRAPRAFAGL